MVAVLTIFFYLVNITYILILHNNISYALQKIYIYNILILRTVAVYNKYNNDYVIRVRRLGINKLYPYATYTHIMCLCSIS